MCMYIRVFLQTTVDGLNTKQNCHGVDIRLLAINLFLEREILLQLKYRQHHSSVMSQGNKEGCYYETEVTLPSCTALERV